MSNKSNRPAFNRDNSVLEMAGGNHDRVAELAYQNWERRGCPSGSPEEDWFQAERELMRERSSDSQHRARSASAAA